MNVTQVAVVSSVRKSSGHILNMKNSDEWAEVRDSSQQDDRAKRTEQHEGQQLDDRAGTRGSHSVLDRLMSFSLRVSCGPCRILKVECEGTSLLSRRDLTC
jgi:hypothetical protein